MKLSSECWKEDIWKAKYRLGMMISHKLLKIYSYKAIMAALNRKECLWTTTINHSLYPYFKEEQTKIDTIKTMALLSEEQEINKNTIFDVYTKTGEKSKRSRLKD